MDKLFYNTLFAMAIVVISMTVVEKNFTGTVLSCLILIHTLECRLALK